MSKYSIKDYEEALLDLIKVEPKDELNDIVILADLIARTKYDTKEPQKETNYDDVLIRIKQCINRSKIVGNSDVVKVSVLEYAIEKEFKTK